MLKKREEGEIKPNNIEGDNNNKESLFKRILRLLWRIILYIITNPIFQLGLLILILNYFGTNLFKHTKIGIFHNYTENIVHDNRCSYHKNIK